MGVTIPSAMRRHVHWGSLSGNKPAHAPITTEAEAEKTWRAFCSAAMARSYLREIETRIVYCDPFCYGAHVASAKVAHTRSAHNAQTMRTLRRQVWSCSPPMVSNAVLLEALSGEISHQTHAGQRGRASVVGFLKNRMTKSPS
jgi:hypothetical protein